MSSNELLVEMIADKREWVRKRALYALEEYLIDPECSDDLQIIIKLLLRKLEEEKNEEIKQTLQNAADLLEPSCA